MTEPTVAAPPAAAPPAADPAAPTRSRRLHVLAGLRWLVARTLAVALFVGGAALGYNAFLTQQPPSTAVVDVATDGVPVPPAVEEFITALMANEPDALRSVVPAEPYQLLIAEMTRWGFTSISTVETLSTFVDGTRSATAIVMAGPTSNGAPITVNLVVHLDKGQLVNFR